MYFVKKTDRAIIASTEIIGTKVVEINGKKFEARIQSGSLKLGVLATGDFDFGDIKIGTPLPLKLTDVVVLDKENKPTTLYWCTPE